MELYENKDWLQELYWDKGLSTYKIAKSIGCHDEKIRRQMIAFDISRRTKGEARQGKNNSMYGRRREKAPNWTGGCREYWQRTARKTWGTWWNQEVPKGYDIHHIDRNLENNEITNLALLTHCYHGGIHSKEGVK